MSIYSVFIYEKHNLPDHKPEWMSAERYDYCEQYDCVVAPAKGFFKNIINRLSANR